MEDSKYHFICIMILLWVGVLSCDVQEGLIPKPNIIMIMTDDLGWGDTGFNGNELVKTPFMDELAGQGIIFDRFYAASPVCSPTRASFLTGRNPLRMNIPGANSGHMLAEEITIPELLQKEGYATAHYGKWHLGTLTKKIKDANRGGREQFFQHFTSPTEHGYDEFFCTESKVPTYDPLKLPSRFSELESKRNGWKAIAKGDTALHYGTYYWDAPEGQVTNNLEGENSRVIMDRVIPFINKSKDEDRPFFATIWFHTPHLPVVADSSRRARYPDMPVDQQLYFGSISAMDEQIGRLWEELERLDLDETTVLWFCSDNGPEDLTPGSAGSFRARKRSLYEGGVRVPAFVVAKEKWTGGRRISLPVVTSDYLPTIVDLLDLPFPSERPIDGISLLPMIDEDRTERGKPLGFIYGNYKKVSWVTDQYKLISPSVEGKYELYDLLKDPSETRDISRQLPAIASDMEAQLNDWLKSVDQSARGLDY